MRVYEFAMKLAESIECDKLIVALSALLHDIGKTYEADDLTLHKKHDEFNVVVAKPFLKSLGLSQEQIDFINQLLLRKSDSVEMKVVNDADILAFYADKRLNMLFLE